MMINETNLCAYRGYLMEKSGDTLDGVKGLLVTAINELKEEGYEPSLIKSIYKLAKAQTETEKPRGMDCDNPDDVADLYEFISSILSVVDMYMSEGGIRSRSDKDSEIAYQVGNLANLMGERCQELRDFGWYEKGDA